MKGTSSNNTSMNIIKDSITKISDTIKVRVNTNDLDSMTYKINTPFRKLLHIIEYLILTLFIIKALEESKLDYSNIFIISFLISLIYSCSDEIHQLFVGRTGTYIDVFIDTMGILLAIFLYKIYLDKRSINKYI